jgi:hypothetical protein
MWISIAREAIYASETSRDRGLCDASFGCILTGDNEIIFTGDKEIRRRGLSRNFS